MAIVVIMSIVVIIMNKSNWDKIRVNMMSNNNNRRYSWERR